MVEKRRLSKFEITGFIYVLAFAFLLLIDNILKTSYKTITFYFYIEFLNITVNLNIIIETIVNVMLLIMFLSLLVWALVKKRDKINDAFNELKAYFNFFDIVPGLSIGWLLSIVFLKTTITYPTFFLDISAIYFTLAGFSFTAGSFYYNINKNIRNGFFRSSSLFAITGFITLLYYLFYDIILNINNPIVGPVMIIFLLIIGFLFWVSFRRLLILISMIPKMNN